MAAPKATTRQDVPESAFFTRRDGVLHCEDVSFETLASYDTPLYVYSGSCIDDAFEKVRKAAESIGARDTLIAYAIKANANLAILRRLGALGCGADIVSGGELERALHAGIDPKRIVFSGVGKRDRELARALDAGIRAIHVESEAELAAISELAGQRGAPATIALRVNPNVDAATHPYIATGLHDTKFGLEMEDAEALLASIDSSPNLRLEGVACHIGSQLETVEPLREAVALLSKFAMKCRGQGVAIESLDVGGGWPMSYGHEDSPYPSHQAFGDAIRQGMGDGGLEPSSISLITEPGRALVGAAGALLTRVVFEKHGTTKRFVIVDAAMTELIRPALYQAYHAITPVRLREGDESPADVVGPVCESGDFFARGRRLPPMQRGDLVAVLGAGAYGREMASQYNARPRAAEVLCEGSSHTVVRTRGDIASLWAGEE